MSVTYGPVFADVININFVCIISLNLAIPLYDNSVTLLLNVDIILVSIFGIGQSKCVTHTSYLLQQDP